MRDSTPARGTAATGLTGGPSGHATGKPTPQELGIDLADLEWQQSGEGDDLIEVAFPEGTWEHGDWVLMRLAADASGRVLVFDRHEWECFLDGARKGEFDDALT